jgi:two-component system phosphate regulon sensor histidine kinase PhoR
MRREIVGNISHDFRTPLAGIKAMVNTLQDGAMNDTEAAGDFLSVSRRSGPADPDGGGTHRIISYRVPDGASEDDAVNINEPGHGMYCPSQPQAERQKLTLTTDLQEDLPGDQGGRERIRQVIINLMHNAIKFNNPQGSVTVATRHEGEMVAVSLVIPVSASHRATCPGFSSGSSRRTGHGPAWVPVWGLPLPSISSSPTAGPFT